MDIFELVEKFGTQARCLELLEQARWNGKPTCPYCNGDKVSRKKEKKQQSRWQCSQCRKSYSVTTKTIFHHTHIKLPHWFAILTLMLNAKKSLSSYQISRDIGLRQGTVLKAQHKIREAMSTDQGTLLKGVLEMDETYIGGKPRKPNKRKDDKPAKRGRGTSKLPVVGIVERGGNVVAKVMNKVKLGAETLTEFVKSAVDTYESVLLTDEYKGYSSMALVLPHTTINHSISFSFDGIFHTNTIEGFWSLLKRAWFGQHHHYTSAKAYLYVAEAAYKYNNRRNGNTFMEMIGKMLKKAS